MSTVDQLIDRVYREVLYLADDQPSRAPLSAAVTETSTTWTLSTTMLSPEELDLYAPGTLVEADRELALVTESATPGTLTVRRGVGGTPAASHVAGALVYAAPAYPRESVFQAVGDNVVALYPRLWRVVTEQMTSASGWVAAPAAAVTPVSYLYPSGSRYHEGRVALLDNFPASATGKALQFHRVPAGKAGYFTYRAAFDRPAAPADNLQTLGVDESWERIVVLGTAAQVLAGRELDTSTLEFVAEQFRAEGYPVGSASRQRNELLRLYEIMVDQARRALLARHEPVVLSEVRW